MTMKFTNNATADLAGSITNVATSITVTTGQGARFPTLGAGEYFFATLIDPSNNLEIVQVTARTADTLTVVRGQDGTTARAYNAGDKIELRVVAAGLTKFAQLDDAQTFTAAQTFRAASAVRVEAAATQDAVVVAGRAGGTGSFAVTLTPATLAANRIYSLPDVGGDSDFVMTAGAQTITGVKTFRAANAVRVEAASTQDAVVLAGRAGGTGSFAVTLTPTTLSASRTLTLQNATGTVALTETTTGRTSATGSSVVPVGTTAQRDASPLTGYFRYNTSTTRFEGYNGTAWGSIGGGATGGGADEVFVENNKNVTVNYTIPSTRNAMSTGPLTVNDGITVTVSDGARWVIL